jgi:histidinol-phosphatase
LNPDLSLALSLADAADEITMKSLRRATLSVRIKEDRSPVSEADEAVETMIRERLGQERPSDAIVGEEFGTSGTSGRQWVIDPIDGTMNYVRGVPVFATLIALEIDRKLQVGVVSAPAMNRRWWAARGDGAFCNGNPLKISDVRSIKKAFVGYSSIRDFKPHDGLLRLLYACERSRGFGDFWMHMLVAEGALDAAMEPRVAHWDMAAVQIVVEEAGGRFTNFEGEARPDGGSAVSTNGVLHDKVLRYLR